MKQLLLFFLSFPLWLFSHQNLKAQTFSGTVKDQSTQQRISFVNISSSGTYGTISNQDGEFNLQLKYLTKNDTIYFSSLGYESKEFALKDLKEKMVFLKPTSFTLEEVFITNKELSAEEILQKVVQNAPKNYQHGNNKYGVFKREKENLKNDDLDIDFRRINFLNKKQRQAFNEELASLGKKSKEVNENYIDTYVLLFKNDEEYKIDPVLATKLADPDKENSVDKILLDVGEIIKEKLERANTFKVKSGLFTLQDSLEIQINSDVDSLNIKWGKNELTRLFKKYDFSEKIDFDFISSPQNFNYQLEGITNMGDEFIYKIHFEPRKNKFKYRGDLFISAESFAILKMNYELVEPEKSPGILRMTFGIQMELKTATETAVFQKDQEENYFLKYVHRLRDEQVYLNRNIRFIENTTEADKIVLKTKFKIDQSRQTNSQFLFNSLGEYSNQEFQQLTEKDKIPLQILRKYDPQVWEEYNIISPEKEIRTFQ